MKIPSFLLLPALLNLLLLFEAFGIPFRDKHLIPYVAYSDNYRPLLYKKLLLTGGDCGRMIEFPDGSEKTESAISVYCDNGGCHATLTKLKSNLGELSLDHLRDRERFQELASKVRVERKDAPIPKSTAFAIRILWAVELRKVRSRPANAPNVTDAELIEFLMDVPDSRALHGDFPELPDERLIALRDLGRKVAKYIEAPMSLRSSMANEIKREARRLASE